MITCRHALMRDCPSHTGRTVVYLERRDIEHAISFRIRFSHALLSFSPYSAHVIALDLFCSQFAFPNTHLLRWLSMQNLLPITMICIRQDKTLCDKTLLLDYSLGYIKRVDLCSHASHAINNAPERREDDESLLCHKLV